jgi:hypothetical protein
MNSFKPGYIIKVSDNNFPETTGVIIDSKPDNLICFNTDIDKRPVFYQVNLQNSQFQLDNNKTINHEDYNELKHSLLQYFNIHKDNQDEIKILDNIMSFAFPNGIPTLKNRSTHIEEHQNEDTNSEFLALGTQVKVKCNPKSSNSFLDNQVLDIYDVFPKGIRVIRRGATSDTNKFYTLFYKQPPYDNSLAGIKEMEILTSKNASLVEKSIKDQLRLKLEKENDKTNGYQTQIIDREGNIYLLDSNTLEFKSDDGKIKGVYYPGSDELNITQRPTDLVPNENVETILIPSDDEDDMQSDTMAQLSATTTNIIDNPNLLSRKRKDFHLDLDLNLADLEEIKEENKLSCQVNPQFGGAEDAGDEMNEDYDSDRDFEDIEGLKTKLAKIGKEIDSDMENDNDDNDTQNQNEKGSGDGEGDNESFDNDEFELEVFDEPIDLDIPKSKVVYRSKKVLIPDDKKIYQPQIQKDEFFKYLLEKYIPNKQLRKNNFLTNQVHRINNRIANLKDELINLRQVKKRRIGDIEDENDENDENDDSEENVNEINSSNEDVLIYNKNKKPLVESYVKNDYRNKFLIPVVLDRKKLYFNNQVTDYHYDFYSQNSNIINKNYQQVITELNEMIEQKGSSKISSITYFQLEKAINEMMKPYKMNDDSKIIGIGFIGNNADKIPDSELPFADFTGLVVRYNRDNFKIQGRDFQESEIEGYNIKAPLIYYIEKIKEKERTLEEEDDDEFVVEDVEKEWMNEEFMETSVENKPNFKKIQEGDRFNIIGYLALPLKHAFNQHQIYYDSLNGLYDNYKDSTGIDEKVITQDTEIESSLSNRDKPTFYYCSDKEVNTLSKEEYLNKLIPDFKEICQVHHQELYESSNWSDLEKVIESYGYNLRYLNIEDWKILSEILDSNLEGQTYQLSKRWLDYQKYLQTDSPSLKTTARLFPLIDRFIIESLENFYEAYPSFDKIIDSDTNRLSWILQQPDHGRLFELLLTKNELIDSERNTNRGELDKQIAKRKQEIEILEGRYKQELINNKRKKENSEESESSSVCEDKTKYKVVKKYQTIKDLESDNYVTISTEDGEKVMIGQYAIVSQNNKVYIRKRLPNDKEVWELSPIKIEQLEDVIKTDCQSTAFNNLKSLVDGNECQFQKDDMQCHNGYLDRVYKQMKYNRKLLAVLEAELEDYNNIEVKKRKIEQEINKAKAFLTSQNNLKKVERDNIIQAYRQIIEDVKKAQQKNKDCQHFQVLNYFNRMKNITLQEKYTLTTMVLKKFQDIEPTFLKELIEGTDINLDDYGRFDVINSNLNFNWTYCSICHQKLVCNHYLYGNSLVINDGELDEKKLKDLYGIEVEQNYNCKVCGEFLVASEEVDMDGFARKADKNDARIITREVIDQEVERREVRRNILDELLDNVENKLDEDSKDMKLFLSTLQTIQSLVRVNLLNEDQEDIISYIKSQPFLSREYFKEYIKKTGQQNQNIQYIEYQATQFFYRFAIYDIISRFLITLQTSIINYSLNNDICKGHIGGYPLGNENDLSTVQYFSCLLDKMAGLPEYSFLSKEPNTESRFISRLKLMIQNQNIQQKYKDTIERKAREISYEEPFASAPSNIWLGYRPSMGVLDAGWNPSTVITPDKVNKIVPNKFHKFMADLRENMSQQSSKLFDAILGLVSKENPAVAFHKETKLGNSCCLTEIKEKGQTSYYDYIISLDPSIRGLIKTLANFDKLKSKIEIKIWKVAEPPAFMKVGEYPKIDPYFHINQEFIITPEMKNKLFMMYVDKGYNLGRHRIFNYYDVCTLTGETKQEIQSIERNDVDYYDLLRSIHKKGKIITVKPVDLVQQNIINNTIDNFISKNPGIKSSKFIFGFLNKLKELITKDDDRELEKHWTLLTQQISEEIETLTNYLTTIKKDVDMKNRLFKLGDYNKIYQEDDLLHINLNNSKSSSSSISSSKSKSKSSSNDEEEDVNDILYKEANNKRYIRMEKNLKNYLFNFFRTSLALVKNNAFDKYRNFDMNTQWKYLIYYREYQDLFSKIFELFNSLTVDLDLFIGTNNKYFTYQNACEFFKCMMLIILNQMIEYKPENKKEKNVQFTSRVDADEIDNLIFNFDTNKADEDIRNFNIKQFSDQKIIILYIYQIIERIFKEEDEFNQLTQGYMTIVTTRKQEERIRKNLNLIAILAQDGRKDLRRVILDQKRLGLIDYEDFEDILNEDIQAGEDKPAYDRDMELIDELNQNSDIDGHIIEEKKKEKMLEYDINDDEYSYLAGEDDDIEDF